MSWMKKKTTTTTTYNDTTETTNTNIATEKRLKWVSSKCTHYCSIEWLCVYVAVCRFYVPHHRHQSQYCYRFVGLFRFCGGYFFSLVAQCVCVSLYLCMLDLPMLSSCLPLRSFSQHVRLAWRNMQQNRGDF